MDTRIDNDVKNVQQTVPAESSTTESDVKITTEASSTTVNQEDQSINVESDNKTIPYDRFKEINEKKNIAESKIAELTDKLKELEDVKTFDTDEIPKNKSDLVAMMNKISKNQHTQLQKETSINSFLKKNNLENKYDAEKIMDKITVVADAIVKSGQTDNYTAALDMAYYVNNGGSKIDERIISDKNINNKVKTYGVGGGNTSANNNIRLKDLSATDHKGMKKWGMTAAEWEEYSD